MTQALPTTQSLSMLSPSLASAWAPSSYPSSVVPALRRVGRPPVAGHPAPSPGMRPAAQSFIPFRSHHPRHRAERRQPIAISRGCSNRGPSRRATGKALEEAREAMEGVWFPIMGLDRLAEAVLSGRGDSTMVAELVQGVRRLPHLLRPAHRLLQDLCEAESEDTGQLVFQLPGAGRRCA